MIPTIPARDAVEVLKKARAGIRDLSRRAIAEHDDIVNACLEDALVTTSRALARLEEDAAADEQIIAPVRAGLDQIEQQN
jgi:hypothetical protein